MKVPAGILDGRSVSKSLAEVRRHKGDPLPAIPPDRQTAETPDPPDSRPEVSGRMQFADTRQQSGEVCHERFWKRDFGDWIVPVSDQPDVHATYPQALVLNV